MLRTLARTVSLALLVPLFATAVARPAAAAAQLAAGAGCGRQPAGRSPVIALSLRGAITTVRADRTQTCRLTGYPPWPAAAPTNYSSIIGAATNAQLSSSGQQIAYLTTSPGNSHDVWIIDSRGRGGPWRITTPSRSLDRSAPTWSPNGRLLAYYEGRQTGMKPASSYLGLSIVIRRVSGREAPLVSRISFPLRGSPNQYSFEPSEPTLAWSPDGGQIASIIGLVERRSLPVGLYIGIADTRIGRTRTITVSFPAGWLGSLPARGSFASGSALDWTPDGAHLIVETIGRGEGGTLTGIWRVSDRGDTAQLFVGTRADVMGHYPASAAVDNSGGFLLSPNRRLIATAPDKRIWMADISGRHGRFIKLRLPRTCTVAQPAWLPDSSGLSYVIQCEQSGGLTYRSSLYAMRTGAKPRFLLAVDDQAPDALNVGQTVGGFGGD